MKVPNEVYAAVLNAFVAPLDVKVSRPWFNQQTGTAYASNRRELVRVGGLNAAPCECAPWESAPSDLDRFFEGFKAISDLGFQSVYRAAEIALARCRVKNAQLVEDELLEDGERAYVRVAGMYFAAGVVRHLCMACAMVYDGVEEPRIFTDGRLLCMACGTVQAIALPVYGFSDACGLHGGDVVCDVRSLFVMESER